MHHSVGTAVVLAGLLYGAGAATTAHAQPEAPVLTAPDATLPIELDADFSEFDRRNDRLVFRRLRIVQGAGHALNEDAPGELVQILRDFLDVP